MVATSDVFENFSRAQSGCHRGFSPASVAAVVLGSTQWADSVLQFFLRIPETARRQAEASIAVSTERGFSLWGAWARFSARMGVELSGPVS